MSERPEAHKDPSPPSDDPPTSPDTTDDAMRKLRELIVGPEKQQIHTIEQRLDNPELHARDVSNVLAEAVHLRQQTDDKLASELYPTVEKAIDRSVRRNPRAIADAIFPIIGPAIRKSISEALAGLVQSINTALEHSLSPRSIRWRFEALRTGKSFAEVVLKYTLEYRVEQVFLIHGEAGLLLLHATADAAATGDADMVSGMLTAIQDFIRDSFGGDESDAVESMKMGELTVLVETGPQAALACVVRGNPPAELREQMHETVELVQLDHGERLVDFDGDTDPFEVSRPAVEACLMEARKEAEKPGKPIAGMLIVAAAIIGLIVWAVFGWLDARNWRSFVDALDAEPGIVVTRQHDDTVHILRDPLSNPPADVAARFEIDPNAIEAEPYRSGDPEMVRRRAVAVLDPPASVLLTFEDGILTLDGDATLAWIDGALAKAGAMFGVDRVDSTRLFATDRDALILEAARRTLDPPQTIKLSLVEGVLVATGEASGEWIAAARAASADVRSIERYEDGTVINTDAATFAAARNRIERATLRYGLNSDDFDAAGRAQLRALADDLAVLQQTRPADTAIRIVVVGHTDDLGTPEAKQRLSLSRAQRVAGMLLNMGVDSDWLDVTGVADREPIDDADQDTARMLSRRVEFRVVTVDPNEGTNP